MIPVGIERDRKIAELRGDNPNDIGKLGFKVGIKPYSTDIASAMVLFTELPTGSTIYKAKDGYTIRVYFGYKERWKTLHKADDIPDAISGAWLIWKENSQ